MFDRLKVARRLDDALDRISSLERQQRELELEWSNTYDKLNKTMLRVVKRAERATAEDQRGTDSGDTAETVESPGALSPRLREINERILARRNRRLPQ